MTDEYRHGNITERFWSFQAWFCICICKLTKNHSMSFRINLCCCYYWTLFYFSSEQNCLDIARAFADCRVVDLVRDKMDTQPRGKEAAKGGKGQKPKSAKEKVSK